MRSSAWYSAPIPEFLEASPLSILGQLVSASDFDVTQSQRNVWLKEIEILRRSLSDIAGWVALEYVVPRLGSRIDAVVISESAVVPIEFKDGETSYKRSDIDQAWDYALDLKNFHAGSHDASIFPILVATGASHSSYDWPRVDPDLVREPRCTNPEHLAYAISDAIGKATGNAGSGSDWVRAPYRPTPTIVQAARALYAEHTVETISRNDAGAKNLSITSAAVESVIDRAARDKFKAIVFVTGVPGAGKTLVGLNVATRRRDTNDRTHAVFLSGNGPLVAVLREALTRDEHERCKMRGEKVRKSVVGQKVKMFIQNVHHFRDEGVRTRDTREVPDDRVVIFDEAQRAWNLEKTALFMKRRKGLSNFDRSEPRFLIEYMDRHEDWSVIVCLVGGGQEINTGEAGISTWLDAVRDHFPSWRVFISPELTDREYAAGSALDRLSSGSKIELDPGLHLATSMRSFRSERVSEFVKALLDIDLARSSELLRIVSDRYPVVVTRDLDAAKQWTRARARGTESVGLVASSGAQRLKPHAVDVRVKVDPVHWFLADASDTRSSHYLEDAATEYQIQGLELDWICVTWDADLRFSSGEWQHRSFNAKGWRRIKAADRRRYLVNAYRVLLTRARQGMVIFVPPGSSDDPTRLPEFYDETYAYLRKVGVPVIA